MTITIPLPGGHKAELKGVKDLTGADQDEYFDALDELRALREIPGLPERPDPENPAVMLPAEPAKPGALRGSDGRSLRDTMLGMLVVSWTRDEPLPLTTKIRRTLPIDVCNALYEAMVPMSNALQGVTEDDDEDDPKASTPGEAPAGTGGSTGTSPGSTQSPLQELPGALSITPPA